MWRGATGEDAKAASAEAASSFEVRKALRLKRKAVLESMLSRRPKPDEDDPADVAAVTQAQTHMGDYKLKSAPNYEVCVCVHL
jgi:hypothetical protein